MKVLAAAIPLLIAVFGFASSRVFVSRRRRLRSGVEVDLALWKTLPEDAEKDDFLAMIKAKIRQVVSEEGDHAYSDRVAAPVLGAVALTGGLFATAALLGKDADGLWTPALILVGTAAVGALIVAGRTLDRLRAALRGDPAPSPPAKFQLWRRLRRLGRRITGRLQE